MTDVVLLGGGETKTRTSRPLDPRPSSSLSPGSGVSVPTTARDRRYGTARWQKVRLGVLNRDLWVCRVVAGCPVHASVADHVIPVAPGMPNALFFDPGNLRAACRGHNLARGFAATLDDHNEPSAVVTIDYTR